MAISGCVQPEVKPEATEAVDLDSAMHREKCPEKGTGKSDCSLDVNGMLDKIGQRIADNRARIDGITVPPSFGPCAEERAQHVSQMIREYVEQNEQQKVKLGELRTALASLDIESQPCGGSDELEQLFEGLGELQEQVYGDAGRLVSYRGYRVTLDSICCARIHIVNRLPASTSASPVGWVLDEWPVQLDEKLEPGQQRKVFCGEMVAGQHSFGVTIQGAVGDDVTVTRPENAWQFDCPAHKVVEVRMTVNLSSDKQVPLAMRIGVVGEAEVIEGER